MNKRVYPILIVLIISISFIVAEFLTAYNLYFYGSRSLFIFDWGILSKEMLVVGGFGKSLTNLIAQFIHIRVIGAGVVACLAALAFVTLTRVNQKINPNNYDYFYLSLLPSLYFISGLSFGQITFNNIVSLIVLLSMVLISYRTKCNLIITTIITIASYFLLGELAIIYPLIVAFRRDMRYNYIPLIIFATLPFLYAMIKVLAYGDVYSKFISTPLLIYISLTLAPVVINRLFTLDYSTQRSVGAIRLYIFAILILSLASYRFITLSKDHKQDKYVALMERAMIESDYEELKLLSQSYPEDDIFKCYVNNLALLSLETLPDSLLRYTQYGIGGLNFGKYGGPFKTNYVPYLYAKLSLYNLAYRYTFESTMTNGLNRINLNQLVDYNLKMGRDNIAAKYSNLLDKTLFSDTFKTPLESPNTAGDLLDIGFSNPYNICVDLIQLAAKQTLTKPQADYLLVGLLLSNRLYEFAKYSDYLKLYYNASSRPYNSAEIPSIYDEALVILKEVMSNEEFAAVGVEPTLKTVKLRQSYEYNYAKNKGNINALGEFKETYMYYIDFVTPYKPSIITDISNL